MGSTSQERRHARVREDILESATRAFARKGFHGTSIDDVAREAGVSPSSLYRYFGGKDDLYRALVNRIAEIILAPFSEPLLATLAFRARLEWLVRRQLSIVEERRELFIAFSDRASMDWQLAGNDDPIGDAYHRWVAGFRDFFEHGIRDGVLRPLDSWNVAYLVSGALSATIFRWIRGQLPVPLQEYVPVLVDMFLAGIGSESDR